MSTGAGPLLVLSSLARCLVLLAIRRRLNGSPTAVLLLAYQAVVRPGALYVRAKGQNRGAGDHSSRVARPAHGLRWLPYFRAMRM